MDHLERLQKAARPKRRLKKPYVSDGRYIRTYRSGEKVDERAPFATLTEQQKERIAIWIDAVLRATGVSQNALFISSIRKATRARTLLINCIWRHTEFRMWNIDDLLGLQKNNVKMHIAKHMDLLKTNEEYRDAYIYAVTVAEAAGILDKK